MIIKNQQIISSKRNLRLSVPTNTKVRLIFLKAEEKKKYYLESDNSDLSELA